MSPSSISVGEGLTMPAKLRNWVNAQKPDIKINLQSRRKTYTTGDRIEGTVHVTAPTDTPFDLAEIEFVGTARTYVERLTTAAAVAGRSEAFHQFLKLTQPALREHYPENGILKAGQTYDFPFIFVIPQQLLPRVCRHGTAHPAVRDAHLLLPPTLGDKDPSDRSAAIDDLAPEMASIRYGIFFRLSKAKEHGDEVFTVPIASTARRVRVVPASDELPPLDASGEGSEYVMRKEKTIRKGMLKGKLGTLVIEAAQPRSLRQSSQGNTESQTTTMATVMLRFDPSDEDSPPPRLGNLNSKLRVSTFFASSARHRFPEKNASLLDISQGSHSEALTLSSRCVANVEWTKCDSSKSPAPERRDSACSTTSLTVGEIPEPSTAYKGKTYYAARLLVPITLPSNKAFVPTFHSCLISRTYALKLELGLQNSGIAPSMDLKLPIQISAEAGQGGNPLSRRTSDDGANDAELDEDVSDFFEPRTVRAPSEGFVGRSRIGSQAPVDAPPVYSSVAQGRHMSVPVY